MLNEKTLKDLAEGESALIKKVCNTDHMRRRLFDLGFAPESMVSCALTAPLGDPKAYVIKGTVIALREEDSSLILVKSL